MASYTLKERQKPFRWLNLLIMNQTIIREKLYCSIKRNRELKVLVKHKKLQIFNIMDHNQTIFKAYIKLTY